MTDWLDERAARASDGWRWTLMSIEWVWLERRRRDMALDAFELGRLIEDELGHEAPEARGEA